MKRQRSRSPITDNLQQGILWAIALIALGALLQWLFKLIV